MLLNKTITRKILETLVHETFSQFGISQCSSLLDSLKLLGFFYATNAGISINLEDLKTPNSKSKCIENANKEILEVSNKWQQGFVSDTERFQRIIDSWNIATEALKNKIIDYYKNFDPTNNLYIMSFSGARGNMSQVRQLVGMRGLMSDQDGKIIDLPIQTNFREGLSSIDYIISSYGARKGIVDTALKTADSGYLTRRLIYIAQDLIIREIDCNIKEGILIEYRKNSTIKNLTGRTLINAINLKTMVPLSISDKILTTNILEELKEISPLLLNIRTSLICKSNGSICQKCYGWDLAQQKIISLGEAVGIIAAQSIGEPGTQLTMRTFHTGGIFTGENIQQILSPFSGKLILPKNLKTINYRTNHGVMVLKLQEETNLSVINWEGKKEDIFLDIGSFLYKNNSTFVKKNELIAEYSLQTLTPGIRKLKPIYTSISGEIRFENLLIRKMLKDKRTIKVNQDDGILWIASGKIFTLPREVNYLFSKKFSNLIPFAKLKIITPISGIIKRENSKIYIFNNEKKIEIDSSVFFKSIKNCKIKISFTFKNYQYVDKHSVIGFIEISPNFSGLIYSLRKKDSKNYQTLFAVMEDDIWKISSDQINNFSFFQDKKAVVRSGNDLDKNLKFSRSGFFLGKNGFQMIFQNAIPIFLTRGTILNYKQGDFVFENKIFATLVNYTQQTEDIVQGLPKIEELIEARRPKNKAYLANRSGIILMNSIINDSKLDSFKRSISDSIIDCSFVLNKEEKIKNRSKLRQEKQIISIGHSIFLKNEVYLYKNFIFNMFLLPSIFNIQGKANGFDNQGKILLKKDEFILTTPTGEQMLVYSKLPLSTWKIDKAKGLNYEKVFKYKNGKIFEHFEINKDDNINILKNKKGDYIIKTSTNELVFLEYISPIQNYELPLTSKVLYESGNFIDIGEPITEGIIDIHDLLNILFKYHSTYDGILLGTIRSLNKFQILLINSIQSIYQSQGVNISSKHIEIIVRQMTSKVVIKESGDTPLLPGELIRLSLINEIYLALKNADSNICYKTPKYEPLLLSSTNSSLSKDGFLSAAGFQETKRVLTKAAIEGTSDWLRGLKECIITGRLIPAGSAFLNYKTYLDNIYLFKN
jgi:DNA-directed RNA polymerase beta' subunit